MNRRAARGWWARPRSVVRSLLLLAGLGIGAAPSRAVGQQSTPTWGDAEHQRWQRQQQRQQENERLQKGTGSSTRPGGDAATDGNAGTSNRSRHVPSGIEDTLSYRDMTCTSCPQRVKAEGHWEMAEFFEKGSYHVDGRSYATPVDLPRAYALYERACELGAPTGCLGAGRLLEAGRGQNPKFSLEELYGKAFVPEPLVGSFMIHAKRSAAQAADARFRLGRAYVNGHQVARDVGKGVLLWWAAAGMGSNEARQALETSEAIAFSGGGFDACERGARAGDTWHMRMLGRAYASGKVICRDPVTAVGWYRKAAYKQDWTAVLLLGRAYASGTGVAKDLRRAASLFRKAAWQGAPGAPSELQRAVDTGVGIPPTTRGFHVRALEELGLMEPPLPRDYGADTAAAIAAYREGRNCRRTIDSGRRSIECPDMQRAADHFRSAAARGLAEASYELGLLVHEGSVMPHDSRPGARRNEALLHYGEAARVGLAKAQVAYGELLCEANDAAWTECAEWFARAASQSDVRAQFLMGWIHSSGVGVAKDETKAVEWLGSAAAAGYDRAQFLLADLIRRGQGVPVDLPRAIDLYSRAAEQGFADAVLALRTLPGPDGWQVEPPWTLPARAGFAGSILLCNVGD